MALPLSNLIRGDFRKAVHHAKLALGMHEPLETYKGNPFKSEARRTRKEHSQEAARSFITMLKRPYFHVRFARLRKQSAVD